MKVLFVTDHIYRSSGVSVFCVEICERLADMGVDVKLALQRPDYPDPYPVRHKEILLPLDMTLRTFEQERWDVVHINGIWNPPYHHIAKIASKNNVPIVWSIHGSLRPWAVHHKWLKKFLALHLYQKNDLKKASLIHFTSKDEALDVERLGIACEKIIAPLGVDVQCRKDSIGESSSIPKERKILSLSRIHPVKALENLIKAWAILKRDAANLARNWKVDIAGECCFPGYVEKLQRLCEKLGVEKDINFCGPLYGDAKTRAYKAASIFVLPSNSENFGSVVVEALSCGTPVITTKGTPWEGLIENRCGWWVDIGEEPLAVALKEALAMDANALSDMGVNGRNWIEREFDWANIAKKFYDAYARL